jgi:mRNA-degrading endonuclease RelE of RelBE toxin-antitoxin system
VQVALDRIAADLGSSERLSVKRVKTIRGVGESVLRMRVGDYRVLFDAIEGDRVVLVLAIVHRSELERWIRSR